MNAELGMAVRYVDRLVDRVRKVEMYRRSPGKRQHVEDGKKGAVPDQMTPEQKKDRDALRKAIAEAVEKGARNRDALNRVLKTTKTGEPPTAVQLRMVNYTRSRLGLPRVSLPVFDREKRREFFERRSQTINYEHATLVASRPLSPPGRRDAEGIT